MQTLIPGDTLEIHITTEGEPRFINPKIKYKLPNGMKGSLSCFVKGNVFFTEITKEMIGENGGLWKIWARADVHIMGCYAKFTSKKILINVKA